MTCCAIIKKDPSAAELYEIDFWLFVSVAVAYLLIPLVVYLITGRNRRIGSNRPEKPGRSQNIVYKSERQSPMKTIMC